MSLRRLRRTWRNFAWSPTKALVVNGSLLTFLCCIVLLGPGYHYTELKTQNIEELHKDISFALTFGAEMEEHKHRLLKSARVNAQKKEDDLEQQYAVAIAYSSICIAFFAFIYSAMAVQLKYTPRIAFAFKHTHTKNDKKHYTLIIANEAECDVYFQEGYIWHHNNKYSLLLPQETNKMVSLHPFQPVSITLTSKQVTLLNENIDNVDVILSTNLGKYYCRKVASIWAPKQSKLC